MKKVEIKWDEENNTEEFWQDLEKYRVNAPDGLVRLIDNSTITVSEEEADEIESFASSLEGWDSEDAPKFAQHPLLFNEIDEEEDAD